MTEHKIIPATIIIVPMILRITKLPNIEYLICFEKIAAMGICIRSTINLANIKPPM